MKRPLFRTLAFTLALALCATPLSDAFAGQTVIIDSDVTGSVVGNSPKPDHSWDYQNDNSADLLDPNGNTVIVNSDVNGEVDGGDAIATGSDDAAATGNSVIINGSDVGAVNGAYAESDSGSATATGNAVVISGGTVNFYVYGGNAYVDSGSGSAQATHNTVTINSGTVGGYVYGGYASSFTSGSATANGNSVTVNGGTVGGNVYGGYAYSGDGSATATGNSVTINNGSTVSGYVYGGAAVSSDSATASNNVVTINGGSTVGGYVYGGYADSDGEDMSGDATHNAVVINGGTVDGDVYGGYSLVDGYGELGTATHNSVTISGEATFTDGGSSLYGGFVGDGGGTPVAGMDAFTGNTLNIWNYTGTSTLYSVQNFEFYNFVIPVTQGANPVLKAGDFFLAESATGRASSIAVNTLGGTGPLSAGTDILLVDGTIRVSSLAAPTVQGKHGATLAYNWTLNDTSGLATQLTATLDSIQASPEAKALSEGFLGALALTTQGADLAAGSGMSNAVSAASVGTSGAANGSGFGAFGAVSGGSMRYHTGSRADMNSISLLAGLAWGVETTPGHLTLGAFAEYGNGSYDTRNSFSNAASVNGDGDTWYTGGGVLGRMDFSKAGPGHWYTEASIRMGQIRNEYDTDDLTDGMGRSVDFDSSSLYYGLHLGAGYIWNINDKASLDLYGKYFWTRQEGDSVTLSTDDPVRFDDADSHRLRLGGRFAYAVNEYVSPYAGVAYEHEFDGEARATTYGYSIDAPDLTGDTGIGEIGLTLKPMQSLPLSFDLGLQGYTGKREGVTGSLQVKFEF